MDLKGVKIIGDDDNIKTGQKYALIIGISNYQYQCFGKLDCAHLDAISFYNYLTAKNGGDIDKNNIMLLINDSACIKNVGPAFEWLARISKSSKPGDEIIVYFSGHGGIINTLKKGYFALFDSDKDNPQSVLTINFLQEYLNNYKSLGVHTILIADACHSGSGRTNNEDITLLSQFLKDRNLLSTEKILSCDEGELSYEDIELKAGVFTYFLIEGLSGKADGYINEQDKDGKISFLELTRYLEDNVSSYCKKRKGKKQFPYIDGKKDKNITIAFPKINTSEFIEEKSKIFLSKEEVSSSGKNNFINNSIYFDSTELINKYNLFKSYIKTDKIYDKNNECAFSIFQEVEKSNISKIYLEDMRYNLLSYLQNDGSNIIQSYLDGNDLPKIPSYKKVLDKKEAALEIVDVDSPLYKKIKSELTFLKAVGLKDTLPNEVYNLLIESQKLNEDAPYVYNELGIYYLKNNNTIEAEKSFKMAEQLYPKWIYPKMNLALLYKDIKPLKALSYFNYVENINNSYAPVYYHLGVLSLNASDKIENLNKCISLDKYFLDAYYHLALVYFKLKKYDAALENFKYIEENEINFVPKEIWWIELEPCKSKTVCIEKIKKMKINDNIYYNMGLISRKISNFEQAILYFDKAILLDSNNSENYFEKGLLYIDLAKSLQNNVDTSAEYINIEKNEQNKHFIIDSLGKKKFRDKNNIGYKITKNECFLFALDNFKSGLNISRNTKDSSNFYLYTSMCYINMEKYDSAIMYLDKINDIKESYFYKGIAYYNKSIYGTALRNFHEYNKLNLNNIETNLYICKIYNKIFDYYSTIKYAEELPKKNKKYTNIYLEEAYAYSKIFEYETALKLYDIVSTIDDNNPNLYIYRGITYFDQSAYIKALSEWEHAKSIAPERKEEIDYIISNAKRILSIK